MTKYLSVFSALLFYITSFTVNAQTIRELKFPYKPGYTLNLKGTMTSFLQDGSKQVDSSFTLYYINSEEEKKGNNWVNFQCTSLSGTERNYFESLLTLNETGMIYQTPDKKASKKNFVQAISLPLTEGKSWTTYMEGKEAVCNCVSTHTFITTANGDVDCFCVQTILTLKKLKGFNYKLKVVEFYNQEIGKVGYNSYYYYEKSNGDTYNVMEIKETLSDYGFEKK